MSCDIVERMVGGEKISIGMVHTQPLPGSLHHMLPVEKIIALAVMDAKNLEAAGFDAIIVENVNDAPYGVEPMSRQKVAAMACICAKVREAVSIPVGIDTCGDQLAGFDVGSMTGITFIRQSYMVDIAVTARGLCLPSGGEAVLYRKRIGAEYIKIFADIQVKHSYPLLPEIPLETSARWAVSAGADVLIVTGAETGKETSAEALQRVRSVASVPVVAGSGVTAENVGVQYAVCDGAIIGSSLKRDRLLTSPIDPLLAEQFMAAVKAL